MLNMISKRGPKEYCREDISLIENYKEALNDTTETWICHHRNEIEMKMSKKDLQVNGLYYNRPASELIFLRNSDHTILHRTGKLHTKESRKKISANHADVSGKKNGMYGRNHTQDSIKKMSDSKSGKKIGHKLFTCPIKFIYLRCKKGYSYSQLAAEFGISKSCARDRVKELCYTKK